MSLGRTPAAVTHPTRCRRRGARGDRDRSLMLIVVATSSESRAVRSRRALRRALWSRDETQKLSQKLGLDSIQATITLSGLVSSAIVVILANLRCVTLTPAMSD